MTTFTNGKQAPAEDAVEIDPLAGSAARSATGLLAPARYYFNLTDGDEVIRDEDGIEVPVVRVTLIHAFEAIEELRREASSPLDEWQGWRLDILDSSGNLIQSLPLDGAAPDPGSRH